MVTRHLLVLTFVYLLQMGRTQKNKATSGHLGLLKVQHCPHWALQLFSKHEKWGR